MNARDIVHAKLMNLIGRPVHIELPSKGRIVDPLLKIEAGNIVTELILRAKEPLNKS